jgi:hypothetical protein
MWTAAAWWSRAASAAQTQESMPPLRRTTARLRLSRLAAFDGMALAQIAALTFYDRIGSDTASGNGIF